MFTFVLSAQMVDAAVSHIKFIQKNIYQRELICLKADEN